MKDHNREQHEREMERGRDFFERIIHDAGAFGEENVDEIDEEWAEFERVLREYRERRMSSNSMDIQQPRRRERRVKNQAFYPCPASFSEPDQYEYSSDDDGSSYDGDGYKNTLVRKFAFNNGTKHVCMHD
ncbi:CLUMA_CG020929, isoform A [Clunio marinus]|uniref:CLUMA_CG020929, isoform A n=1 Tax=Clunio marinus TaxID=568069 RepID=A0A1J1J8N6_9DIPT|nr:CLUMA_CG020929, isoform A [Clunio marinus]